MPNAFGASLITVLVLLDPLGNAPVFLSLTERQDQRTRNRTALIAVVAAPVILGVFAAFRSASLIAARVRPSLTRALTRVVGLLVAAIAVHFIASAIGEWFHNG